MGTKEGIKYDSGKPTVGEMIKDFAPAIREVARVWKFGADKYEKSNWQKLEDAARLWFILRKKAWTKNEDHDTIRAEKI